MVPLANWLRHLRTSALPAWCLPRYSSDCHTPRPAVPRPCPCPCTHLTLAATSVPMVDIALGALAHALAADLVPDPRGAHARGRQAGGSVTVCTWQKSIALAGRAAGTLRKLGIALRIPVPTQGFLSCAYRRSSWPRSSDHPYTDRCPHQCSRRRRLPSMHPHSHSLSTTLQFLLVGSSVSHGSACRCGGDQWNCSDQTQPKHSAQLLVEGAGNEVRLGSGASGQQRAGSTA